MSLVLVSDESFSETSSTVTTDDCQKMAPYYDDVLFELNRDPYRLSNRAASIMAVSNFFFLVYLVMMIVVATIVIELKTPESITVIQQQNWYFPAYDRFVEVFNIIWASFLSLVLCTGIGLSMLDLSAERRLLISWGHLVLLIIGSVVQEVFCVLYFVMLGDAETTAFFSSLFGVFSVWCIGCASYKVYALTKESGDYRQALIELKIMSTSSMVAEP
ncbi:developmentally-regulated membrane protein [Acrasis kona]|uniref:Developmentally-regulated membrane protein n=1 Tax=Acrasis kona TaxID=1008807 RepID=A0AAW2YZT6_9EUKA